MTLLFQWGKTLELPFELLAAAAVFVSSQQRRKKCNFWCGIGTVAALWACCEGIIKLLILPHCSSSIAGFLLALLWSAASFGTAAAAIYTFCELDAIVAFYYATLAYLTQHFSYCLCEFVFPGISQASALAPNAVQSAFRLLIILGIFAGSYFIAWKFIAQPLSKSGQTSPGIGRSLAVMLIGLGFCLGLSAVVQTHLALSTVLYRCCLTYAMFCCALLLWNQVDLHNRLAQQHELDLQRQLWLRHKAQYERAKDSVKLINRKCHELKRQLGAFERLASTEQTQAAMQEMQQSISVYDSIVETGNEILDTILSEKSLSCAANGIAFTCVADGRAVDDIEAIDLFSMLGNALDNAVDAVLPLTDPDKRAISVSIFSGQGVTLLQVENYFTGALTFEDGLPVTTKGDSTCYGFGLKSIRHTAEKYGGVVTVRAEDELFLLRITLLQNK